MRLVTHILFSIAITLPLNLVFHTHYILALIPVAFVNVAMDAAGHKNMMRTKLTHSPLSATVTALVWGAALYFLLPLIGLSIPFYFVLLSSVMGGWSHLFLDSMTMGGIFVFGKRFAIAHFKLGLIDIPFIIVSFVGLFYVISALGA